MYVNNILRVVIFWSSYLGLFETPESFLVRKPADVFVNFSSFFLQVVNVILIIFSFFVQIPYPTLKLKNVKTFLKHISAQICGKRCIIITAATTK